MDGGRKVNGVVSTLRKARVATTVAADELRKAHASSFNPDCNVQLDRLFVCESALLLDKGNFAYSMIILSTSYINYFFKRAWTF